MVWWVLVCKAGVEWSTLKALHAQAHDHLAYTIRRVVAYYTPTLHVAAHNAHSYGVPSNGGMAARNGVHLPASSFRMDLHLLEAAYLSSAQQLRLVKF